MQIEIVEQLSYGAGAIESTIEFENKVNRQLSEFKDLEIEVIGVDFVVQNNKLKAFIKINK
ncbi:hypothetical protein [Flavobacterium sp.]|jgi:hypothetical protein|uniref:hypothetical protein n=1 Tax=Flavobacterium sp. TaxID=239 RepID=UPI0037BF084A